MKLGLGLSLSLLGGILVAVSCTDTALVELRYDDPAPDGGAWISERYTQGQDSLDVLFVVDNTSGMAGVQQALTAGIGPFIERLQISRLDWRIGVISTDLGIEPFSGPGCAIPGGDGAELRHEPRIQGCTPPPDRYLTDKNVSDPAAGFACIASLGEGGCGFERPLQATLKAVSPTEMPDANRGFLRDTALLMVIWVSNEDDCSASDMHLYDPDDLSFGGWDSFRCFAHDVTCAGRAADGSLTGCTSGRQGSPLVSVKDMAGTLKALKPAGAVVVVAITGPVSPVKTEGRGRAQKVAPSCSGPAGIQAKPAIRFHELVSEFGEDGMVVSPCEPDLGLSLARAVSRLKTSTGPYCLRHRLRDPGRPGCRVEVTSPGGGPVSMPPSGDGSPGFKIIHPLLPGWRTERWTSTSWSVLLPARR